jgi:hypothetical protein
MPDPAENLPGFTMQRGLRRLIGFRTIATMELPVARTGLSFHQTYIA